MATSNAVLGFGTLLQIGDGGNPEVFTTIAEVTSISGPNLTKNFVEVTHMESLNGYDEFIPGLKSGGEITCELNFVPSDTTFTTLKTAYDNDTLSNYKIVFPDSAGTTASFAAYVSAISPTAPVADKMSLSITLKITAAVTFA